MRFIEMKNGVNQLGYSKVKATFYTFVVILLLIGGWFVYKFIFAPVAPANIGINAPAQKVLPTTATYTDKAKVYTLTYPAGWTVSPNSALNIVFNYPLVDPIVLTFTPPAPSDSGFGAAGQFEIIAFKNTTPSAVMTEAKTTSGPASPHVTSLGTYPALNMQVVSQGMPTYTDDDYTLSHGIYTIYATLRTEQGSDSAAQIQGYDASSYIPAYLNILKSIKFLN